jgi:hypothetical protein
MLLWNDNWCDCTCPIKTNGANNEGHVTLEEAFHIVKKID